MAIYSISDHVNPIDQPTPNIHQQFHIKSYSLESYHLLPNNNDAICRVRDLSTGALRQVLASRLLLMPFGKDEAYLLECVKAKTIGGQ